MVNTPVLLIAFNRPEMLQKVVDSLSVHRLSKLYAFVDNAREGNVDDINKIEMCKKIIDKINFCDEVITIYPEVNLGCGGGPFYAITTAFKNETKLIILEDDCVPSAAFPSFCEELLDRYENDQEVWMISGDNFSEAFGTETETYYFSGYAHFWGWATWKRSWQKVVLSVDEYQEKMEMILLKRFPDKNEREFFYNEISSNFNKAEYAGWDYQAALTLWKNEGLSIIPSKNLVSNIGLQGTHFSGERRPFFKLQVAENFIITKHPSRIERNSNYDTFHFKNHWIKAYRRPLIKRIINHLRKRINRLMDNGLF
jgi:hypothetical protein